MADIDKIVNELGKLTVVEALDLSKKLAEEWNIDLDNLQAGAVAPAEAAKPADAPVSVILTGYGEKKINVLKAVKEVMGLGLMEAKQFVEALPKPIEEECDKEKADEIKKKIEAAGGTVEVK
jgi:large subunit ribosomal protein L7/L12